MKIIITPDSSFQALSDNVSLKIFDEIDATNEYAIQPFAPEHYNDVDLVAHKILANNHTKITCVQSLNYLPVLSKISHQAILHDRHGLELAYAFQVSSISNDNPLKINAKDIQHKDAFTQEVKDVPIQTIIQKIQDTPTYIRQSTFDLYHKLDKEGKIPHDIIACEIKYEYPEPRKFLQQFPTIASMPLYGLDYSWQKELVELTGTHYMGIQVLGSLLANWYYICLGGSARLFSLLPTRNLHLWAYDLGNYHYKVPAPISLPYCGLTQDYPFLINQAIYDTDWPTITWEYED